VTDVDHRQAAIDAVVQAQKDFTPCFDHPDRMREARAHRYVDAAAPHLAAAERERIGRQFMVEASRLSGMKLTDAAKVLRAMAAAIAPADCEEAAGAP
jgi:hypothetical protein